MNSLLISFVIFGIGFILCLILILRKKWLVSKKHIEEYKEGRDKTTFRKGEVIEEKEVEYHGAGFLSKIIGSFVTILVGVSLIGPINEAVKKTCNPNSSYSSNLTDGAINTLNCAGMNGAILQIIPLFFALTIVIVAIVMMVNNLRDAGLV